MSVDPQPATALSEEQPQAAPASAGSFQPYIPDAARVPELTLPGVLVGSVLGIIFGASSLYLVLRVGMTVSASIPVAVLAITVFRAFSRWTGLRRATILENNIVQTAGSAGESIRVDGVPSDRTLSVGTFAGAGAAGGFFAGTRFMQPIGQRRSYISFVR